MNRCWVPTMVMGLVLTATAARGQAVQAGASSMELSGRVQVQFSTTSVGQDDVGPGNAPVPSELELRRLYVATQFRVDGWLSGMLQADFAGGTAALVDAYADARVMDGLIVRAGRFKKPFGMLALYRHPQLPLIERAVRIRGVPELVGVPGESHYLLEQGGYVGREVGVMVHGSTGALSYATGVFSGEGPNTGEARSSKAFAGRASITPVGPLELGAGVSVQPTGILDGVGEEVRGVTYAVDAEWGAFRRPGLRVLAETAYGDDPLLVVADAAPTMVGGQVMLAWFAPRDGRVEGVEPVLRVSWADPSTDATGDEGLLLTSGANLYFNGESRLMVNAEAYAPSAAGLDPVFTLVASLQVLF